MSLKHMDYRTPDTGSRSLECMYWGYNSLDISNLTNYNVVASLGETTDNIYNTIQGTENHGYLPSNKRSFSGPKCPNDTDLQYQIAALSSYGYIPSPYNNDDTRNTMYYQVSNPSSTANAMSDLDGKNNTNIITALATAESWKTASSITNSYTSGYYPAACCCWRYHTDGTSQGDWYLPACGELGYIMPKYNQIMASFNTLISAYGDSVARELINDYHWSSSEYSGYGARRMSPNYGIVDYDNKSNEYCYVRAFLRVPAPIKYGPIQLTGGSISDIPASGGTSGAPTGYTYTQTWGYGTSSTNGGIITSGAEISYTTVHAENLGTTLKGRTKVGDSILTITMNGVTNEFNIPVY
jgi:hypothetical protein